MQFSHLLLLIAFITFTVADETDLEKAPDAQSSPVQRAPYYRDPTFLRLVLLYAATTFVMKPQTPLLGSETVRKGISSNYLGILLAIMPATSTIVAPIFGQRLPQFGPQRMIIFGTSLCALSSFLFAALHYIPTTPFIVLAALLRIAFGIGQTASSTAAVSYLNIVYETDFTIATSIYYNFGTIFSMFIPIFSAWLEEFGGISHQTQRMSVF